MNRDEIIEKLNTWPGLRISIEPPPGKKASPGEAWVTFRLAYRDRSRVWRAIQAAMSDGGTKHPTVGLGYLCGSYMSGFPMPADVFESRGRRRWSRPLPLKRDQLEDLLHALDFARDRAGYDDAGTAMTAIAEDFLGNNVKKGQPSGRPTRTPCAGLTGERREPPQTHPNPDTDSSPSRTPSTEAASCPHAEGRRGEDHPAAGKARRSRRRRKRKPGRSPRGGAPRSIYSRRGRRERPRALSNQEIMEALEGVAALECLTVPELAVRSRLQEEQLRLAALNAEWLYELGMVPKKNGEMRRVHIPDEEELEPTQHAVLHNVLAPLVDSPIAYGIPGRDQFDAARLHVGQDYVGTLDIDNFFPSVTARVVRLLLTKMGAGPDVVESLVRLVTYRGRLPQGAPTSQVIANLLLAPSDHRLYAHALCLGVRLTRWVDDYVVSGPDGAAVQEMMRLVEEELARLGLRSKPAKRSIVPRHRRQIAYGLIVNNGVSIPSARRKAIRAEAFWAKEQGCILASRYNRITSDLAYLRMVHPREGEWLAKHLVGVRVVPDPKRRRSAA